MFKACFGNFIKNLKYVFVELGFMYLALMLGIDLFAKKLGMGFSEFSEAFKQMIDTQDLSLFMEGLERIAAGFMEGVTGFFIIQLVGILLGYILIMLMMRTDVERRNILKVLLSAIVDGVILILFIMAMTGISSIADWGSIVALILFLPLYSLFTLVGSYLNHGLKLLTFKKIVSFKNIIKLSVMNLLIIICTVAIGVLCVFITNIFIGIILFVCLLMVGFATISLNADAFVNRILQEAKIVQRIDQESDRLLHEGFGKDYGDVKIEQPKVDTIEGQPEAPAIEQPNADEKVEEQPKVEEVKDEQPKVEEEKKPKKPKAKTK